MNLDELSFTKHEIKNEKSKARYEYNTNYSRQQSKPIDNIPYPSISIYKPILKKAIFKLNSHTKVSCAVFNSAT